ncbi:unnamed protein product, partial [Effrenium voratum]
GLASLQSSCLRLHAQSNIHKAAIIAYYSPTSSPLKLLAESTLDNKLLAGHVPQLPDMVRLWSWITNPVSFKTMSSLSLTETFLQQSRDVLGKHQSGLVQAWSIGTPKLEELDEDWSKHKADALMGCLINYFVCWFELTASRLDLLYINDKFIRISRCSHLKLRRRLCRLWPPCSLISLARPMPKGSRTL